MNTRSVGRCACVVVVSAAMLKELKDSGLPQLKELNHSGLPHIEYSIPEFPVVVSNTIVNTATASALALPMVRK